MAKLKINNGKLSVPDCVTIPYIEGDGVGMEITPVAQAVIDAAIKKMLWWVSKYRMVGSACWRESL